MQLFFRSARLLPKAVTTVAAAFALAAPGAQAASDVIAVEFPAVEGPIASATPGDPSRNYTFLATPVDLAARGYVEEEFFVSGTACRYNGVGAGDATIRDCGFPYKTRIVVRRPASAGSFNGTVLAEWQNVTAQYDIDHYWHESSDYIMREGYAWVGISAQRAGVEPVPNPAVGINTLKAWSPLRYGSLGVTVGGTILDDALSFDIFIQAAKALRVTNGTGPLGPLVPQVVIAVGTSQSGGRLALLHNSVAPLYEPVVDAYFIGESTAALRTDLPTRSLRLLSEVDVRPNFAPPDGPTYRHWEVAGASHADFGFVSNIQPLLLRDQVLQQTPTCLRPTLSRIPKRYTYHAAWSHMDAWVRQGTLPPVAPRITYNGTTIARDAFGNALGGIRLSEHEVATAENSDTNGPAPPLVPSSGFCRLFGTHVPFTDAQLAALYRNHGRYVSQVVRVNADNVRAGFLLQPDSVESNVDAARSGFGK